MTKKTNDKSTNNDPQNTTQKTKDRTTQTSLKTADELRCSGRVSTSTCGAHRVTLITNPMISHDEEKSRVCS